MNQNQHEEASKKQTIILCTGNKNKLKEFIQIMGDRFHIDSEPVDLPELQGPPLQIAKEKALIAYERIGKACVTEDTSLCFNALNGMPGPYVKWFLEAAGPEGLSKILDGFEDKTGYAQCILSYMGPELKEPIQFVGQTSGVIVRPKGPGHFGWDPIFQPDGYTETYAEMDKDIKNKISHRLKAIQKFIDHFLNICHLIKLSLHYKFGLILGSAWYSIAKYFQTRKKALPIVLFEDLPLWSTPKCTISGISLTNNMTSICSTSGGKEMDIKGFSKLNIDKGKFLQMSWLSSLVRGVVGKETYYKQVRPCWRNPIRAFKKIKKIGIKVSNHGGAGYKLSVLI